MLGLIQFFSFLYLPDIMMFKEQPQSAKYDVMEPCKYLTNSKIQGRKISKTPGNIYTSLRMNKPKRTGQSTMESLGHNTSIAQLVGHGCKVVNVRPEDVLPALRHALTSGVIPQTSGIYMQTTSGNVPFDSDYTELVLSEKPGVLAMPEVKDCLPYPSVPEYYNVIETPTEKGVDVPNDLSKLDLEEVGQLLVELNLSNHVERFRREKIDGSLLMDLDSDVLQTELGFSKFQALKLAKFVKGWRPKLNTTAEKTTM